MYAAAPVREFFSDSVIDSPHTGTLAATTPPGTLPQQPAGRPTTPTPPPADHTVLYVGLGLGVLAVGGVVVYLATRKKGRRR